MDIPGCFSLRLRVPVAAALVAVVLTASAGAAVRADRLTVVSTAFADGARIPGAYAYHGCAATAQNRSPQVRWNGVPAGTKSFAVTMFDPDAPTGHGFWHWVMFDIPADTRQLAPGAGNPGSAPRGAVLGHIDFGESAYGGPCPPPGDSAHHYVLTVRALDIAVVPGGTAATTGPQLLAAVEGHVLAQGKIVGRFSR